MRAGRHNITPVGILCDSGRSAARWLGLVTVLAGCSVTGRPLVECPLSLGQQQQAVLEIVPRGTSRGEAEKRLRAAGIEFAPAGGGSMYYLSLWNRPDGERWHINVALLFDSGGKLYQLRPADATTSVVTSNPQSDSGLTATEGSGHAAESQRPDFEREAIDDGSARVAFPAQNGLGRGGTR